MSKLGHSILSQVGGNTAKLFFVSGQRPKFRFERRLNTSDSLNMLGAAIVDALFHWFEELIAMFYCTEDKEGFVQRINLKCMVHILTPAGYIIY